MSLNAGIDLHANNSYLAVIDETDKLVTSRRCRNELASIRRVLEPHQEELAARVSASKARACARTATPICPGPSTGLRGDLALDRLDPDEWLERHRLRLEKPETTRYPNGCYPIEIGTPALEKNTSTP